MLASMKDHRGSVNSIMVSPKTGAEAISASSDGCCIIWDLETVKRRASFFSNTFFKSVAYHPDESQVRPHWPPATPPPLPTEGAISHTLCPIW
jgi:WD40 repeat protein